MTTSFKSFNEQKTLSLLGLFLYVLFLGKKILTYFGTTTNNVIKYSESSTKSSFFTISAKLLVSKLPLSK